MELEPAIHATKRLRRRLRDPSGFQTNDLPLVLCVLAFLIAVGLASLGRTHHRKELRSFLCLENLLRIERGVATAELSCPVVHLPYRQEEGTSGTVIVCPDPEKHLRLDTYLARRGESWVFQMSFDSASGNSRQAIELENVTASIQVESSGVILETRPHFLLRYVVLPGGLMVSVFCIFGALFVAVAVLRDPDRSMTDTLIELTAAFVFLVGVVGMGSLALAVTLGGWTERTELVQAEGSIIIRDCILSTWRCSEDRLDSVRAVLPAFGGKGFSAVAFYEEDGELRGRTLFRSSGKDWRSVALMNRVFSESSDAP